MIRKANRSDCINLAALSLEVWLRTYCVDGIRTENSQFALSAFTEDSFEKILADSSRRVLVFTENIYLRGYVLINLESHYQSEENGFEIEKMIFGDEFERTRESYIKRKLGYSAELEIGDIQIYQGLKSWLDAVKVVAENNDCAVALVKNWKGSGLTSSFEQWHVAETSYLLS
jgi:diamine N-acetyltransferase